MPVSNRTCAALANALAKWSHAEISVIALRYGTRDHDPEGASCKHRAVAFVEVLGCGQPRDDAQESQLQDVIEYFLGETSERAFATSEEIAVLLRELELDGFVFRDGRLMPTTGGPMPLATQSNQLTEALQAADFAVALRHYIQALDNFSRGNYEAAGGSIGSFLESLLEELATRATGTSHNDPRANLDALRAENLIQDGQWNLVRGCWAGVQEGGRHQGVAGHDLALFRVQVGTAAGSFLLSLI